VVAVAQAMANDGTREAICALQEAARQLSPNGDGHERAAALRAAMLPFDTLKEPHKSYTQYARYPSRVHSIEELPVALAYLTWSQGDYRRAVLGGANYGRDSDSIASMVGALIGGLDGQSGLPADWVETVERVNQLNIAMMSKQLADLAAEIYAQDQQQAEARHKALGEHLR
jgi:ADP-ribosylglycohydrolase